MEILQVEGIERKQIGRNRGREEVVAEPGGLSAT